ncbi:MAG: hypothetical protein ABFS42_03415 [Candidatus Krumholzibacteriota bacterium]
MDFKNIQVGKLLPASHTGLVAGLVALILVILVQRCFNAVFYPILYNEDGRQMVAWFVNNPHPGEIFRFYAGYTSLFPNLIGYLSVTVFPLPVVPYLFVAVSLSLAVGALSIFSLKRFRFIMPDDRSRALVCLLIALFPLGNHALITSLTFCIWNLFFMALLLLLAPLPESRASRAGLFVFISLAIVSNPSSVLFIPICIALFFIRRGRGERIFLAGIALVAVVYSVAGVTKTLDPARLDAGLFRMAMEGIGQRVVFEPLLGNNLRVILFEAQHSSVIHYLAWCLAAGVLFLVLNNLRHPALKNKLPMFGFVGYLIVSLTVIAVLGRLDMYGDLLAVRWGQRYFFSQQMLFVFIAVSFAVIAVDWKGMSVAARSALLVLLVGYGLYLNVHHRFFFQTSKKEGQTVARFLRDAEQRLNEGPRDPNSPREIVLNRRDEWNIRIKLPDESD